MRKRFIIGAFLLVSSVSAQQDDTIVEVVPDDMEAEVSDASGASAAGASGSMVPTTGDLPEVPTSQVPSAGAEMPAATPDAPPVEVVGAAPAAQAGQATEQGAPQARQAAEQGVAQAEHGTADSLFAPQVSADGSTEVSSVPAAADWVEQAQGVRPVPGFRPANDPRRGDGHVVSQSRMFSVSGAEALRVGAIATHADELRGQLIRLLDLGENWRYPIAIRLYGEYGDAPVSRPIRLRLQVIGSEPTFLIRVHCGGGIQLQELSRAILTMLLYEFSLREVKGDAMPDSMNLPEWLITGLHHTILSRTGKLDRRLYRSLSEKSEMLSPEKIISTKEPWKLDTASRQVYDVSCGVLVQTLLNRPGGKGQLRELVRASALSDSTPAELIKQFFAELGTDQQELARWWALELAAISEPRGNEFMTPLETDKALSEALVMQYFDPETGRVRPVELDNPYEMARLKGWQTQCRQSLDLLQELSLRCFVSYHPVILEYIRAIHMMLDGAAADEVQQVIGPQMELRTRFVTTAIRARDYLDWYEITTRGKLDGQSLERYMETVRELRREIPGPSTPLSRYLEDIELLYSLKANEELPDHLRPTAPTPAQQPSRQPVNQQ